MTKRRVKDIMQRALPTCGPSASLDSLAHRLDDQTPAVIVVDDDGYAIGLVSRTELLLARVRAAHEQAAPLLASDIMVPAIATCTPETPLFDAVTTMTRNRINLLLVVKPGVSRLYPLGVIAMTDIIRELVRETSDGSRPSLVH